MVVWTEEGAARLIQWVSLAEAMAEVAVGDVAQRQRQHQLHRTCPAADHQSREQVQAVWDYQMLCKAQKLKRREHEIRSQSDGQLSKCE